MTEEDDIKNKWELQSWSTLTATGVQEVNFRSYPNMSQRTSVYTHCYRCGCTCCSPVGGPSVDSGNDAAKIL